ncbi:MAG: hypothetical protein JO263_10480 [Candidatus Eremiobacteraeota bacterium]|nr:hypothetical protein [Candidatus Eremiobacteraeota bacterium]
MQIGSNEHKELFCRSFVNTHEPHDPRDWPWPELDALSLARLRALPIWTLDAVVREALELQGYEEDRHGRILQCMIDLASLSAVTR